jgi:uncharacterized membrane protein YgdD (TMEM256/DUF423 family)
VSDPVAKDWLRTGAQYELIHALAVFGCIAVWRPGARAAAVAVWSFLGGAALFSWSLYLMALTGERWLGAVTPIGGVLLLVGWGSLAWAALAGTGDAPPA